MSIVGSDWEALKRFNLAELYQNQHPTKVTATLNGNAKPQSVTADEAAAAPSITPHNTGS
jgi:tRNA acetyltransferase TAN1